MPVRRVRTPLLARLRFLAYALRLLAPRLGLLAALTIAGGVTLLGRGSAQEVGALDFVAACYQVYTQLFFEHVSDLPDDWVLRLMYFTVPIVGAFIVAEGLLKVGLSLFDFNNHQTAWIRIMAQTYRDHIILIGLGHVGFRVLEELLERSHPVIVVEARGDGPFVEEARARGVPLMIGDARRESVLRDLGLDHAKCLIACTNDDLVNLEVGLDARQINPNIRLVMRFFDQNMARKLGKAFSVESIFSTSALSAPLFAAAALDERIHGAYRLGDTLMATLELDITPTSPLVGKNATEIRALLDAPVVGVRRGKEPPTHRFGREEPRHAGESIIVHVAVDEIAAVKARARG
ncbi:potassium channel family protein [Nannocystis pusilla]|uniref:NAD-binding protein n=1 Tax=Nannocystis pusilla TaxID=889268 RepID=A0ABS7TSV1_9BACT|nr:potassium channel protein [Nannocystis pusilla]MBZ5711312.1 NAD-binding protein [Nannocystis pusilla]